MEGNSSIEVKFKNPK